jgi:hypothetical protein
MVAVSAMLREEAGSDRLGEDRVRVVSGTLQPGQVPFCRGPIMTLNPSRNVATPQSPPGGIIVISYTKC